MTPHRRKLLTLACLTVIGCSNLRPTRDGNPATGSVEGVVVDSAGRGVPRAVVTVYTSDVPPQELASGTTDAGGRFTVEKIPPGANRVVRAVRAGRAVSIRATRTGVSITGGRTRDLGTLELSAGGN